MYQINKSVYRLIQNYIFVFLWDLTSNKYHCNKIMKVINEYR